ncbi:hypothetical protein T484DRAFT_1941841 [Baffinella frigidus]|nr:hypothetical protein T484DRAFT_1941841 [Cryptophyta sp. CCMP2293]
MPGTPVLGRMWSRLSMCFQLSPHLLVCSSLSQGALLRHGRALVDRAPGGVGSVRDWRGDQVGSTIAPNRGCASDSMACKCMDCFQRVTKRVEGRN